MNSNIQERFTRWKLYSGHENLYAQDLAESIDTLIPGVSTSIQDNISLILSLCCKSGEIENTEQWLWSEKSYDSALEANLQFVTMWSFKKALEQFNIPIVLNDKFPIVTKIIKSIEITPFIVKENKDAYIIISSSFIRFINEYLLCFLRLSGLGENSINNDFKIFNSNYVGGGFAEKSIKVNFKRSIQIIQNLMGLVAGKETFWNFIKQDANFEENGFPVYFPEFLKNIMLDVSKDMGYYSDESSLKYNSHTEYYLYPVLLFTIFHELSHYILNHLDEEEVINNSYRNIDEEISADQFAMYLYVDFVNTFVPKNHNDLDITIFLSGPSIYFNAFQVQELIKQTFYKKDIDKRRKLSKNYMELNKRFEAIKEMLNKVHQSEKITNRERKISMSAIGEFEVLKIMTLMGASQILNGKMISFDEIYLTKS
jgi:Zn-dependent peptidase ImmA (M78 family)